MRRFGGGLSRRSAGVAIDGFVSLAACKKNQRY
jgi:hypothetical protein